VNFWILLQFEATAFAICLVYSSLIIMDEIGAEVSQKIRVR